MKVSDDMKNIWTILYNEAKAKLNPRTITKHLLNNGYIVITKNGINNTASIRTVQSLGFKDCASELIFTNK